MRIKILPALAGFSLLLLAGVGPSQAAPSREATTWQVSIVDFAFDPEILQVKVGDTVVWVNNDKAGHTVDSDRREDEAIGPLDSDTLMPGDSYTYTFVDVGMNKYHCELHADMMRGSVIVSANARP
ncbi:MAG: plastocyanin/azurin family copper-binding protein [bacterium]